MATTTATDEGESSTGKPGFEEAVHLTIAHYQAHPYRGAFHILLGCLTGGMWLLGWMAVDVLMTVLGFGDVEGRRELRAHE